MLQTQYIDSFHPFCNTSVFQHIRGFSVRERRKLLFHIHQIHQFEPRLEKFPLVNSGILVPYHGFRIRRILPVSLAIMKERYNIRIIPKKYKRYPFFNFKEAYRTYLFPFVESILMDGRTQRRPFWNSQVIEQNLESYHQQSIDYSRTITNIITTELILRKFIDGD
jgi:hypothetical protein